MEIQVLQPQQDGVCAICGKTLTLFGNKPLIDGTMCRDCAQLASVWLTDKEISKLNANQAKNHLVYREQNHQNLEAFHPDVIVKGKFSLYIDTVNHLFTVSKKDIIDENADVLPLSAISEVAFMDEKYKGTDCIDVYFEIRLKGCQFKKIRFRVNDFPGMEQASQQHIAARAKSNEYIQAFTTSGRFECNKLQLKRR